ncbi:MAG: phytanoyl-CoA dioxygenase [Caulobacterales bacterium 68-7]|nr:phytanoyl-CoA dioxygenase family protein [Caulobacterales bacterium]OJU11135.1 MAG: phytanoyl-CoA dioxygenase [Caulobacterales bacterium 68-7]
MTSHDFDVDGFVRDGFLRVDNAFDPQLAEACRGVLWCEMGLDPDGPAGWAQPVVRLGFHAEAPFREAANTPLLHAAYDALVGAGRWLPPGGLGTFPIRFPSAADPGDTGWHIDVSFGHEAPDFLDWRANVTSRGRALLMLFLLSDIGEHDAPTLIRVGSHVDMARRLGPAGEAGLTLREMLADDFGGSVGRRETSATGRAGTVYLCHPFLVHSAQPLRSGSPRFIAQPPLLPAEPLRLDRKKGESPVERAIRQAVEAAP